MPRDCRLGSRRQPCRRARGVRSSGADPWTDYIVSRGQALAAWGRGGRDDLLVAELARLRNEGERLGLNITIPAIESALAGGGPDGRGRAEMFSLGSASAPAGPCENIEMADDSAEHPAPLALPEAPPRNR